jgi:hypothetical protein
MIRKLITNSIKTTNLFRIHFKFLTLPTYKTVLPFSTNSTKNNDHAEQIKQLKK